MPRVAWDKASGSLEQKRAVKVAGGWEAPKLVMREGPDYYTETFYDNGLLVSAGYGKSVRLKNLV